MLIILGVFLVFIFIYLGKCVYCYCILRNFKVSNIKIVGFDMILD